MIAVIPARYGSTRFPGKPLADICGKPMIQWVYEHCKSVKVFDKVVVATDDERIANVCDKNKMNYIMTRKDHPEHISRVHEVSCQIPSDFYVCINGDEPLLTEETIESALPSSSQLNGAFFYGTFRKLTNPVETVEGSNIKLALTSDNRCVYMSRSVIPYPKGTSLFEYHKYVGIECFSKASLDFFVSTPKGRLETIEDLDHLRFIENGKELFFKEVTSDSISVDTKNDLEKVRKIMCSRI